MFYAINRSLKTLYLPRISYNYKYYLIRAGELGLGSSREPPKKIQIEIHFIFTTWLIKKILLNFNLCENIRVKV